MAEKQKILHIVEAMGGGIFTYIVTLANALCEEYDVTIACGVRNETPENYQDYFDKRVKLIYVEHFSRSVRLNNDLRATKELKKICNEINPDIIHLHSSKAGALGRLFLRGRAQKMFYTPHGYSFFMEDIAPIRRKIFRGIEKICGNTNCITVACGQGEWEQSQRVCKKSTYISNGIDLKNVDKVMEEPFEKTTPFTVYTVGRIDYQKNPKMFNKIAALLPDIRFCWIGDGEMKKELKSSNIEVTGWQESAKALRVARQGDIFILPSLWEGLPISLLEAMYMKKPCIVSNVVGNRDIIVHGATGYICETAEQFAEKIMQIKNGEGLEVVETAYNDILEHYNDAWMCERYAQLYKDDNIA